MWQIDRLEGCRCGDFCSKDHFQCCFEESWIAELVKGKQNGLLLELKGIENGVSRISSLSYCSAHYTFFGILSLPTASRCILLSCASVCCPLASARAGTFGVHLTACICPVSKHTVHDEGEHWPFGLSCNACLPRYNAKKCVDGVPPDDCLVTTTEW